MTIKRNLTNWTTCLFLCKIIANYVYNAFMWIPSTLESCSRPIHIHTYIQAIKCFPILYSTFFVLTSLLSWVRNNVSKRNLIVVVVAVATDKVDPSLASAWHRGVHVLLVHGAWRTYIRRVPREHSLQARRMCLDKERLH